MEKQLEQNGASAKPSYIELLEGGQNNPVLLLNQLPLEEVNQYCDVEAMNCNSTTTDIEMNGPPRDTIMTPSISEKPSKSENCKGAIIQKIDSLSPKHTFGIAKNSSRGTTPAPSLLGSDERKSTKSLAMKLTGMIVAVAVIVVVWGLMLLPMVLYHLPQDTAEVTAECSSPEVYSGICQGFLQQQQTCLGLSGNGVSVPPGRGNEIQAQRFINVLPNFLTLSPECDAVIRQFLCFYIFGLCDTSGELYLPSSGECRMVTEEICDPELEQAMMLIAGNPDIRLSQCDSLPVSSNPGSTEVCLVGNSSNSTDTRINDTVTAKSNCSEGFYLEGVCLPECGVWQQFSDAAIIAVDFIIIFSIVVYLISAVVAIVLSLIRYKRILKFPSVFLIYGILAGAIYMSFILIGYFDRDTLFCSSRSLLESRNEPTTFCTVQGVIFYYCSMLLALFWFCYVVAVFWTIKFPLTAQQFKKKGYFKFLHFGMLVVALLLPWTTVGIVLGTDGLVISRSPTILCFARNDTVAFYGYVLPMSIILATGVSLIIIIFWILIGLIRVHYKATKTGSLANMLQAHLYINPAELKILIVFTYPIVFAVILLISFTVSTRNRRALKQDLTSYFACESLGSAVNCPRDFTSALVEIDILVDLSLVLLAIYPIVNLVYIVNIEELKMFFKGKCDRISLFQSNRK